MSVWIRKTWWCSCWIDGELTGFCWRHVWTHIIVFKFNAMGALYYYITQWSRFPCTNLKTNALGVKRNFFKRWMNGIINNKPKIRRLKAFEKVRVFFDLLMQQLAFWVDLSTTPMAWWWERLFSTTMRITPLRYSS